MSRVGQVWDLDSIGIVLVLSSSERNIHPRRYTMHRCLNLVTGETFTELESSGNPWSRWRSNSRVA